MRDDAAADFPDFIFSSKMLEHDETNKDSDSKINVIFILEPVFGFKNSVDS